jgi:hypothetical protein
VGSLRWDEWKLFYWKAVMEVTLLEEKRGAEYLAGAVLKM